MVIQLQREIPDEEMDTSVYVVGIDDGSKHVGISVIQKCKTKVKTIFKGTIELRDDVSKRMDTRRGYRRYRRSHKRYRLVRFNNRASSKKEGRIAPSIKQKKDSILRVVNKFVSFLPLIVKIVLEDVAMDNRALQEGKSLYRWQYQKSNRLDENLRKAVILRDKNSCRNCGITDCRIEVHHIIPRKLKGNDTVDNRISLCKECHEDVTGNELKHVDKFQTMIGGKNIRFDYAQHVVQGKTYLRKKLAEIAEVILTTGGDTANSRIDLGIEKTHSNDAIVIADGKDVSVKDWVIKPRRKKIKAITKEMRGFRCRDVVKYTKKNGDIYHGYITSLDPRRNTCNISMFDGTQLKKYGLGRLTLLYRPNGLMWV